MTTASALTKPDWGVVGFRYDQVVQPVLDRHCIECHNERNQPAGVDLKEVSSRRCAQCHEDKLPRKYYTRMLKPENNSFLLAPLAKMAGGTQKCGTPIFKTKDDPDYKKIINVFAPIRKLLRETPRADMVPFETGR
jgi:predicted CXXCH cytochrome family protein